MKKMIYLDNASTSFPKPLGVQEAMIHYLNHVGANPGRSGHQLAMEAAKIIEHTREQVARLFHIDDRSNVIFTLNVTESLNTIINGFLKKGDHVITTAMEHNSVMRPLKHLETDGRISVSVIPCDHKGFLNLDALGRAITNKTALVIVNHASNVCGTIQDIGAIRSIIGEIPLLVDAAQTAGCYPIDVKKDRIDFLAFTGHKALMGPQGTGGFYIRKGLSVEPLKRGGTGSVSEEMVQPDTLPDAFESGTQNNVGLAGLGAGVTFVLSEGVQKIRNHEKRLINAFLDELHHVQGVTIYGPLDAEYQTATVSFTFDSIMPGMDEPGFTGCGSINLAWLEEGIPMAEAGDLLDSEHDILVRTGLHCAPLAHETLGTYPEGTIRVSFGYFNTLEDVAYTTRVIRTIAETQI
jgi:cysteine desulfurase / selenocysteine lyase